jgi:hypothetical protein
LFAVVHLKHIFIFIGDGKFKGTGSGAARSVAFCVSVSTMEALNSRMPVEVKTVKKKKKQEAWLQC